MEGFNAGPMHYIDSPLSLDDVTTAEYVNALSSYSHQEPAPSYSTEQFVRACNLNFTPQSLPQEALQSYHSAYEESISDTTSYVGATRQGRPTPETPSIEHGNTLLSFQNFTCHLALLDYAFRRTSISFAAQLHGMFFLAESLRTAVEDGSAPPAELTCYRRNLFQITGSIIVPRGLRCVITEKGDRVPILTQELVVSASESVEGNPVKIISIPWKTSASSTSSVPEDKSEKEPAPVSLNMMVSQDANTEYITFPIAWKRLQFRVATANNGRRKELQQHFSIRLSVIATLSTGAKVAICEANSGAIIVRGRSPRNFQQRKDYPLTGSRGSLRQGLPTSSMTTRKSTSDSVPLLLPQIAASDSEPRSLVTQHKPYEAGASNFAFNDWNIPPASGPFTAYPVSTLSGSPSSPATSTYAHSSPDLSRSRKISYRKKPLISPMPSVPSVVEDQDYFQQSDSKPQRRSHKVARTRITTSPTKSAYCLPNPFRLSSSLPPTTSSISETHCLLPGEKMASVDMAYAQLPPGMNNWMPHVDSMYRPQLMHQTTMPPAGTVYRLPVMHETIMSPAESMYTPHLVQQSEFSPRAGSKHLARDQGGSKRSYTEDVN